MKSWVSFDTNNGIFELSPTEKTRLGLWRGAKIILNDSKEETAYLLNFWVRPKKPIKGCLSEDGLGNEKEEDDD